MFEREIHLEAFSKPLLSGLTIGFGSLGGRRGGSGEGGLIRARALGTFQAGISERLAPLLNFLKIF